MSHRTSQGPRHYHAPQLRVANRVRDPLFDLVHAMLILGNRFLSLRSSHSMVRQDREHLHRDWAFVDPGKNNSETLPAGNYEYPFEAVLPGDSPESVEGLPDTWVIYRMKATVQRGRFAKDVQARKHLRVIRTFDESALELSHAMVPVPHLAIYQRWLT